MQYCWLGIVGYGYSIKGMVVCIGIIVQPLQPAHWLDSIVMSRNCHGDCLLGKATQPARAQSLNLGNGHVISTKNNWCDTPYFWPQNQWQLFWSVELLSTTIAILLHFHYLGSGAIVHNVVDLLKESLEVL